MRIGCYEADLTFRTRFTLAEIIGGNARILQNAVLRNLRGGTGDWMKVTLYLDQHRRTEKSIRGLNGENAAEKAGELVGAFTIPPNLAPGEHEATVSVIASDTSRVEQKARFTVYPASVVPIDFERARYLAAWMDETDEMRFFAGEAVQNPSADPEVCLRSIYQALYAKELTYCPVPSLTDSDCESVSSLPSVLNHGGSCMDLSLLLASLIRLVGGAPVLLLYAAHITAGCLTRKTDFVTDINPVSVRGRVENGEVILVEATGVCRNGDMRLDYEMSRRFAESFLAKTDGCVLVNVLAALRGGVSRVTGDRVKCPVCGYGGISPDMDTECPACGASVTRKEPAKKPVRAAAVPRGVRFETCVGGCAVTGIGAETPRDLELPDKWQDRPVVEIAAGAFKGRGLTSVVLPADLSAIRDEAFMNCAQLRTVLFPDTLTSLGNRAFCKSGVSKIELPCSLRSIPFAAFHNCPNLEQVILPEGLEEIEAHAFGGCPRLRSVRLPSTVTRVDRHAFDEGCVLEE